MNTVAFPFLDSVSSPATRWRLTDDALVEEGKGLVRVYGRWDRRFGCWLTSPGTPQVAMVAFRPNWPFLGARGRWLEPEGRRDDAWFASRAAIAGYFSLVPVTVRRLVAPHGDRQWELLETIWREPGAARRLDRSGK
jgi:hypothetical protein